MRLSLTPTNLVSTSSNSVHFTIEVNRRSCSAHPVLPAIDMMLKNLETVGITLSLSGILLAAATLLKSGQQPSSSEDIKFAEDVLQKWQFSILPNLSTGQNRLICVPPQQDFFQRTGTELLGVGVNLLVASHLYSVNLNAWNITTGNARFDYTAIYPPTNSSLEIEVRARLDRNNWRIAVQEANKKLTAKANKSHRDFTVAAALLFAPRSTSPKRAVRTKDILIMDPSGNNTPHNPSQNLRNIIQHYIRFFERQESLNEKNFTRLFAQRLRDLASSDEESFQRYLHEGDATLCYDKRGGKKPWRQVFRYDGQRFCGTAFDGYAWPMEVGGRKPEVGVGAYYFGLWEPIIEALRDGHIEDLAELKVTPGTTE